MEHTPHASDPAGWFSEHSCFSWAGMPQVAALAASQRSAAAHAGCGLAQACGRHHVFARWSQKPGCLAATPPASRGCTAAVTTAFAWLRPQLLCPMQHHPCMDRCRCCLPSFGALWHTLTSLRGLALQWKNRLQRGVHWHWHGIHDFMSRAALSKQLCKKSGGSQVLFLLPQWTAVLVGSSPAYTCRATVLCLAHAAVRPHSASSAAHTCRGSRAAKTDVCGQNLREAPSA